MTVPPQAWSPPTPGPEEGLRRPPLRAAPPCPGLLPDQQLPRQPRAWFNGDFADLRDDGAEKKMTS